MWHWQLKKKLSEHRPILIITSAATVLHVLFFFLLLFVYRGDTLHFDIFQDQSQRNCQIIVMPLYKKAPARQSSSEDVTPRGAYAGSAKMSSLSAKPVTSAIKSVVEKKAKENKATTSIVQKPFVKLRVNSGKPKNKVTKAKNKKLISKKDLKTAQNKNSEQEKHDTKEIAQKSVVKKTEKIEKKHYEESSTPAMSLKNSQDEFTLSLTKGAENSALAESNQDALYIGTDEAAFLVMQENVQKEVSEAWHPPAGCRSDLVCSLAMIVDWQGVISEIKVVQPSGVAMYDMAAKQALSTFVPPKWAFGKELVINFRQNPI